MSAVASSTAYVQTSIPGVACARRELDATRVVDVHRGRVARAGSNSVAFASKYASSDPW